MTYSVFIDGAAGTTGLEIADRLATRDDLSLIALDDGQRKDLAARRDALNAADFVILCLPDDAARESVDLIDNDKTRVIDASSAHRIVPGWTYGFAEFRKGQRQDIGNSWRVSNPGCYPTGFLALMTPLLDAQLIPAHTGYTVNAVSGYSGGGKPLIERMRKLAPDIGFRSYGLDMGHKHTPEMQVHSGLATAPIFAPSVVRAFRGMLVEVPLHLDGKRGFADAETLHAALSAHYDGEALVTVVPWHEMQDMNEILLNENAPATDRLTLYVFSNHAGTQARLVAHLDNLGKGASGAAVQNLNIMAGLQETRGLRI